MLPLSSPEAILRHDLLNIVTVIMLQLQELGSTKLSKKNLEDLHAIEKQLKALAVLLNQNKTVKRANTKTGSTK